MPKLRIAGIVKESVVDGPGIRFVVFSQGCKHNCKGCHNPGTHDLNSGKLVDTEEILNEIKKDPLLLGVTFSGGEPFLQAKPFADLAKKIHKLGLNIITYTGYKFEDLISQMNRENSYEELLNNTDILVDGKFILEKKSLMLKFRGSKNQRVIDVKESLREKKVIEINF